MSKLRSEARFTLRDGRTAVVRSAATADAGAQRCLLDAVAAEPEIPLLRLPGSASQRALRARLAAAAGHARELWLVALVEGRLVGSMHLSG
jgi:hypothetical protein